MGSGAGHAYVKFARINPFVRYGLPMISLTVLGSLALSHLQQGRKDVAKALDDEEWAVIGATQHLSREGPLPGQEQGQKKKKKIDLERELKDFREKVDIDAYDYKPVPKLRQEE